MIAVPTISRVPTPNAERDAWTVTARETGKSHAPSAVKTSTVKTTGMGATNAERFRRHVEMLEEVGGELAEMNEWLSGFHEFEQSA